MKRILHIIQSLDTGGAERVVAEYALAHDRTRYAPEVCCVFGGGHLVAGLEEAGVPVHVLGRRWKLDPIALFKLTLLIARRRFDVVHNHNFSALAIGAPAAILGGARTLVRTEHNVVHRKTGARTLLSRMFAVREDAQIAVSDAVRRSQVERGRVPPRRFATVRNGISSVRLSAPDGREELRAELGLPQDALVFLSVGSLTVQKDFVNLLEAAAVVVRQVPNARFVIVGDGPEEALLLERRRELGLDEHVLLVGRRTDVPRLLRGSDVFVLPSAWEGLPITVLEAMAAGRPCVSTRVGGIPEILRSEENSIVVEPGDHGALAEALLRLAGDPGLRDRLVARATEVFEAGYTAAAMTRQTEALYELASVGRADLAASGPIKVLFVIGQLSYGGAERQVVELAKRLPRDRYEPVVCCLAGKGPLAAELEETGVRVVSIAKRAGVASGASRTLLDLVRAERPAVLHSYLFSANWRSVLVGRLARVPLVITSVRNVDIHGASALTLIERLLAGLNDRVVANAEAVKEYVSRAHGINPDKIVVVRNGVSTDRVLSLATDAAPRNGAPLTVLIVASLTPKKDHATFISAAAAVESRMPGVRFIVVGDGPLKGELERRADEVGLAGSIEFRGEVGDVGRVFAEADVCVLTSLKEGCSNFILEAMFAGKPVVATDAGGNRELVRDGDTGFIVPVGDGEGVAARLLEILSSSQLRRRMGERGRERALENFTVGRMVDETVRLYETTLRERVGGLVDWAYARAARLDRDASAVPAAGETDGSRPDVDTLPEGEGARAA
ncbi:MAG: glycosyltransferase [Candidatus Eisenbacteria bacterium]